VSATRVCTTILDRATVQMTELVENGRPLSADELDAFRHAYAEEAAQADAVVLIGSLPNGTPASLYRELVEQTPCPAVLDFRGEGLLESLACKPRCVKPNRHELAQTMRKPLERDDDLVAAMRALNERGAEWVVVTDGARPVWLTSTAATYRFHPPRVDSIVNPIGCGDALAAGIVVATREGRSMVDAVRFGVAAAADNLGQLLACRVDRSRVDAWTELVEVETT